MCSAGAVIANPYSKSPLEKGFRSVSFHVPGRCPHLPQIVDTPAKSGFADSRPIGYIATGSGCRLVAVPAFKAVRGAIMLSPVGSIPTPSADIVCFFRFVPYQVFSFALWERHQYILSSECDCGLLSEQKETHYER